MADLNTNELFTVHALKNGYAATIAATGETVVGMTLSEVCATAQGEVAALAAGMATSRTTPALAKKKKWVKVGDDDDPFPDDPDEVKQVVKGRNKISQ